MWCTTLKNYAPTLTLTDILSKIKSCCCRKDVANEYADITETETGNDYSCSIFRKTHGLMVSEMRTENRQDTKTAAILTITNSEQIKPNIPSSQQTKKYCNIGRCLLISLHICTPICYITLIGSACALSIQDAKNTTDRCEPNESACRQYYRGYFYSTILFYVFSIIGTVPALFYSIQTFLDHGYRFAYLRLEVQQQCLNRRNKAIKQFVRMVDNSFFQITSEDSKKLFRANFFSAAFIIDSIAYGAAYLLYMYIENKLDSVPRQFIVAFLGVSGFLLLFFMVVMNFQIDKTKDILLYLNSYQNLEDQNLTDGSNHNTQPHARIHSPGQTQNNNVTELQTIVRYFDSYAHIFGYVPKISTLVIVMLTLAAQKLIPLILKDHGIIKSDTVN